LQLHGRKNRRHNAAAANAVLDIIQKDGFLEGVLETSAALFDGVNKVAARHPQIIESVRGRGLMLGMCCKVANIDLVAAMRERRVLLVPAGDNVARMLPPLTIDSHLTHDIHASVSLLQERLVLWASVVNLTDGDPPFTGREMNYDALTHNPFGRIVKIGLTYRLTQ